MPQEKSQEFPKKLIKSINSCNQFKVVNFSKLSLKNN